MKITARLIFIISLMIPLTFLSCGDDDDGGDNITVNNPREEQEETGGSNGGGDSGETSCLTSTQRSNITSLMDRLSADSPMGGVTSADIYSEDGTVTSHDFPGTAFSFGRATENSWAVGYAVCTTPNPEECGTASATAVFRDGCFYVNDIRARINSSSPSRLRYTTTSNGIRLVTNASVSSSGRFTYSETYYDNGRRTLRLEFNEYVTSLRSNSVLGNDFTETLLEALRFSGNENTSIKDALPLK